MSEQEKQAIGILGLGIIGMGIARKLRADGREVYVWNRTPKTEPNALGSPAEVARHAQVVQVFVRDGVALSEVVADMVPVLSPNHIVLAHATVAPDEMRAAADAVAATGAAFLDCPFTGSKDAAAAGKVNYYVGGDEAVLERVRPVLEASSNSITHLGDIGAATVFKIATNMISATTVVILAEALAVAQRGGVELDKMEQALAVNACSSGLVNMKLPSMLAGDYDPHFSLKNMFKDAQYGLGLGKGLGIELPALSTTANLMFRSMQKGKGDLDFSVLASRYQDSGETDTSDTPDE